MLLLNNEFNINHNNIPYYKMSKSVNKKLENFIKDKLKVLN